MGIDWSKVKNNAKAKDDQQYAAMKADTEKRGPYSVSTGTSQPTDFIPAQKSEMVSLENQRRQAQVDMDIDTMNALDARMKSIRASAGQQTFADRADENMSGWVKGTAAAYSKAAEDALNFVKHLNTVNSNEYKAARQAEQNAAHYQEMLDRGTWDNGKPLTDADRAQLTTLIQRSGGKVKAASDYLDKVNAPLASAAEKVGGFGDRMVQESGAHNEAARTGATALEKILLDTGNVAGDVVSDFALNAMAPGLGTASRVTRMYGSGSRAAEEKGLGGLGQFGYGATKAALGEATNRLFSGNPILEKATGKGALDDLLFPNLGRTVPGAMVKSGLGEAVEETAENLADIPIQKIFFGDKADQVSAKDIGYDALIAAIIGGITGISGKKNTDTRDGEGNPRISQNTPAGDMPVDAEGNSMGAAENAAQGVSDGVMEQEAQRLFGQQKTASTGETVNSGKIDPLDQAIADSVSKPQTAKRDILSELLLGGKRVDQSTLTQEQFDAAVSANEQGTVGMDASGKVYQVDPEQHIDRRTADSVSSRNMNAFQFDHPELHSYYQQAAEALIADADLSLQFPMNRSYERTMQGNKVNQSVQASAHLRQAMDETGLSRAEIIDAAQRIVHDQGQENVKAAKQVEIILDSMLTNGWSTMMGDTVGPNQAYIDAKSSIMGSQPTMQSGEGLPMMDDGLGAKTSQFKRGQRVSDAKSVYDEADNATDQQRTYDITCGEGRHMNIYTTEELLEARRSITSTLNKCEKVILKLQPDKSQHTLTARRIAAFRIALDLIERELNSMTIRLEEPGDYREVENLTREAFWNKYRPGCFEHYVLHRYRDRPEFVKELDYVVEEDGKIVAHIMYSRAQITADDGSTIPIMIFGPVSVLPEKQGKGYGSKLIRHTLDLAEKLGCGAVAITGDPGYYHRFGFVSGSGLGIYYNGLPRSEEAPFFMVKELKEGFLEGITGVYRDPEGYFVEYDDVEAFDAKFPPKEKKKLSGQLV